MWHFGRLSVQTHNNEKKSTKKAENHQHIQSYTAATNNKIEPKLLYIAKRMEILASNKKRSYDIGRLACGGDIIRASQQTPIKWRFACFSWWQEVQVDERSSCICVTLALWKK